MLIKHGLKVLLLFGCFIWPSVSMAKQTESPVMGIATIPAPKDLSYRDKQKIINTVENIAEHQVKVIKLFKASNGLIGVLLKPDGIAEKDKRKSKEVIVYADSQGRYVMIGQVFSPDGRNVSQLDRERLIVKPQAARAFDDAVKLHWVATGKDTAPHGLYVVADPNCSYCHKLYVKLQPYVAKGQLQVRWIWAGFLKPDSRTRSMLIMQSKSPEEEIHQNEIGFNPQTESGGLNVPDNTIFTAKTQQDLQNNNAYMQSHGFQGTPVLVYQNQKSGNSTYFGVPDDKALQKIINSAKSFHSINNKERSL